MDPEPVLDTSRQTAAERTAVEREGSRAVEASPAMSAGRPAELLRPPDDLPTDPARFFRCAPPPPHGPGGHRAGQAGTPAAAHAGHGGPTGPAASTADVPELPASALDRLGASPLPKTGFPFIGFLAGVYEHVAAVARGEPPREEP